MYMVWYPISSDCTMSPKIESCRKGCCKAQSCSKTLCSSSPRAHISKACNCRKGICDEQEGSYHLWYGSYWNSLFKFEAVLLLFGSGPTHSFIPTRSALLLNLKNVKVYVKYIIKISNDSIVECPVFNKHIPITIDGTIFLGHLI